jgi:twitching motility two-component system response regulator PilH
MTKKILIVEDEADILELLAEEFKAIGDYVIYQAGDGEEAISMTRTFSPDAVVLDIQLPKLNGYEVCRRLKTDPLTSRVKLLMITGMAQNSDRQKALALGADAYFTKPFDLTELVNKVEELLNGG